MAHFTRTGNFATPWKASRSPSSAVRLLLGLRHHVLEGVEQLACASALVWPLTASVIIEPDAWLIEQPRPRKATSLITPSSTATSTAISSPQSGLKPSALAVGVVERALVPRVAVVVEDQLAVEVVEFWFGKGRHEYRYT